MVDVPIIWEFIHPWAALQASWRIHDLLKYVRLLETGVSKLIFGLFDVALYTEHECTTVVAINEVLMKWGNCPSPIKTAYRMYTEVIDLAKFWHQHGISDLRHPCNGHGIGSMAHLCLWFSYPLSPPLLGFKRRSHKQPTSCPVPGYLT